MTLSEHLNALGVIPKPQPKPQPRKVVATGWVPKDRNDECPY